MLTYKLWSRASDVNLFEKGKKYILNAYDLENKCGMLDGKNRYAMLQPSGMCSK